MPKRRIWKQQDLPAVGAVFAMPLADGRWGACRVLTASPPAGPGPRWVAEGEGLVLAAATPWIGDHPPGLTEPGLRSILVLSHHNWKNQPEVIRINEPPPAAFRYLGVIEPTPHERGLEGCPLPRGTRRRDLSAV